MTDLQKAFHLTDADIAADAARQADLHAFWNRKLEALSGVSGDAIHVDTRKGREKIKRYSQELSRGCARELKLAILNARNYYVGALRGTGKGAEIAGAIDPRQQYSHVLSRAMHRVRHGRRYLGGIFADKKFFFVRMKGDQFGYVAPVEGGPRRAISQIISGHGGYNDRNTKYFQGNAARIGGIMRVIPPELTDKTYRHALHKRGINSVGAIPLPSPQKPRPIVAKLQQYVRDNFKRDVEHIRAKLADGRIK